MREEKEMWELILGVARRDARIRAVVLNGSRANPAVRPDRLQDYDVVYVVEETASFRRQPDWVDCFGPRLVMQCPEEMDAALGRPADLDRCYGYLIQLADGNRIDLHLETRDFLEEAPWEDGLSVALLDKDGTLPAFPPPSDQRHWVRRPTEQEFRHCCNEFRWLLVNVGKALWREELPLALDYLERLLRPELVRMLGWGIGLRRGFSVNLGKSGRWLREYLTPEEWDRFRATYSPCEAGRAWEAVWAMLGLFEETAEQAAQALGMPLHAEEAQGARTYLEWVRSLPHG